MIPSAATETVQDLELLGVDQKFPDELCELPSACRQPEDTQWAEISQVTRYALAYQAPTGTALFQEGGGGSFLALLAKNHFDRLAEDHPLLAYHPEDLASAVPAAAPHQLPAGRLSGELSDLTANNPFPPPFGHNRRPC